MKKWANKSRGLKYYNSGKDVYGKPFHVQDGSWACFRGVRIYAYNVDGKEVCLSLKESGANKLIDGLKKFLKAT